MIAILCVDNNNGMMFCRRRQSQDRLLREHVIHLIGLHKLWMNSYSKTQFINTDSAQILIDDNFLEKALHGDYCFVEDMDISQYTEKLEKIILFHWNRLYPADMFFTLDLSEWTLEEKEDFTGHSHEKITKEVYSK